MENRQLIKSRITPTQCDCVTRQQPASMSISLAGTTFVRFATSQILCEYGMFEHRTFKGAMPPPLEVGLIKFQETVWYLWNTIRPFSGQGSASDPAGGACSAPQILQLVGEGASFSCPKTQPAFGPSSLWLRPFGPHPEPE